ncbi:MAG: SDR family NAD(P)-dependent oxidoreductase [Betaproteobacteria bacterium]|nr:SDR family NAD(P)-dependent oxidoreductase [Betaproteobacteria bacterium]
MQDFEGRVAVITGGASGLGLAMARRFAREGMRIVLGDVQRDALDGAVASFEEAGVPVLGVACDVSRQPDVDALRDAAVARFGAVHVLCNNAGVAPGGLVWENTLEDWQWCLGVNVYGVIHGLRSFVPFLLQQAEPAHIVNTASVAGLLSPPGMGIYCVSKHAVVTMTECLHHDLAAKTDKVRASVLCPAYVPTGIADSERNRPDALSNPAREKSADEVAREEALRHAVHSGRITAEQVADMVFDAIRDERFYVITHPKIKGAIETRMQDILLERSPTDTSRPQPRTQT